MPHRPAKEWMDIHMAVEEIQSFVAGKSFSDYCASKMLQAALERKLEIIGEALNRIEDLDKEGLKASLPEYRRIIGLRNVIAHGYDLVDNEIIWDLVTNKLQALKDRVKQIMS